MNLLIFFGCFICVMLSFYLGQLSIRRRIATRILEDPDTLIKIINELKTLNNKVNELTEPTQVIIEKHNNVFFVYNSNTWAFLGQGDSIDSAMKTIAEKFPNMTFRYDDLT